MTETQMKLIQNNLTIFSEEMVVQNLCDRKLWQIVQTTDSKNNIIALDELLKKAAITELSQRKSRPHTPVH